MFNHEIGKCENCQNWIDEDGLDAKALPVLPVCNVEDCKAPAYMGERCSTHANSEEIPANDRLCRVCGDFLYAEGHHACACCVALAGWPGAGATA